MLKQKQENIRQVSKAGRLLVSFSVVGTHAQTWHCKASLCVLALHARLYLQLLCTCS